MIGVDTNVLLRFYVDDQSDREAVKQRRASAKLFSSGKILFIPKSVLLECEWVLRAVYAFSSDQVLAVFHHLINLPQIRVEDPDTLDAAIEAFGAGLDFADAMHLATCAGCESFATFDDRKMRRKAARMGLKPICEVPQE